MVKDYSTAIMFDLKMSSLNGILCVNAFISMCLLFNPSPVTALYYIPFINVTDIGRTTFTLEWTWSYLDDGKEEEPAGINISTYTVDSFITLVQTDEVLNGINISTYTVTDIEAWSRYRSCITPFTIETTQPYGSNETCTEDILTMYDPWTTKSQFAVVCALWLIFALLVARLIEFIWPRAEKRTFSLDAFDESDDGDGQTDGEKKDDAGIHNFGFIRSEEEGSLAEDWNAAAIAALKYSDDATLEDQGDIVTELQKLSGNDIPNVEELHDNNNDDPQLAKDENMSTSVYQEIPAADNLYAEVPREESVLGSGRVDQSGYDAVGYDWRENEPAEDMLPTQPSRHADEYDPYNDYQNREAIMGEMDLDDYANYF